MMRLLAVLALLFLPLAAVAQDNPIIRRMADFVQDYNAQDAASIALYYAKGAVLLPPNEPALIGRDAIAAHYTRAFEAGARDLQTRTLDIRPLGKAAAVEVGETSVTAGPQRIIGRYMHLWEIEEGKLVMSRDIYHVLKAD